MALVSYILIPEGWEAKYWQNLSPTSAFLYPRVTKTTRFLSRQKKLELRGRSLFGWLAEYWRQLTDEEKQNWKEAMAEIGLTNWQGFIHDTAARWKYQFPGLSIPSILHQGYVGWLQIDSPDKEIKITQLHPKFYWIKKLAPGHKRFWVPVEVTEDFALPLKIALSYCSNLVPAGANPFAKFYALVWHSFQGKDLMTELKIDLDFQTGWKKAEATLSEIEGYIIHYDLFFHLKNLTGCLYIDNLKTEHNVQNWARDPRCNEIEKVHPRIWFCIPKNWVGVIVPENAFYRSVFREF